MVIIHATLMIAGLISLAIAIVTVMLLKKKRWHFKAHKTLAHISFLCVLLGFMGALFMVSRFGYGHFAIPHAQLGLLSIVCMTLTASLGILQFKFRQYASSFHRIHIWLGRITFIAIFFNVMSGLILIGVLD